jgi:hypothetical protein
MPDEAGRGLQREQGKHQNDNPVIEPGTVMNSSCAIPVYTGMAF